MKKIIIVLVALAATFTAKAQFAMDMSSMDMSMMGMDMSMMGSQYSSVTVTEEEIPYEDRVYEELMDAKMGTGLGVASTITGIVITAKGWKSDVKADRNIFTVTGASVSVLGAAITAFAINRWCYYSSEYKRISASGEGIGIAYSF